MRDAFSAIVELDEQKEKLKISLDSNPITLSALGVERTIEVLSKYRAGMQPAETPLPHQGEPVQVRTDPPWLLGPNVHLGGATLSFHYAGFGWVHIEMTKAMLDELGIAIAKARSSPSSPSALQ